MNSFFSSSGKRLAEQNENYYTWWSYNLSKELLEVSFPVGRIRGIVCASVASRPEDK